MTTESIRIETFFPVPIGTLWTAITVNEVLTQWMADKITGRPREGAEFSWTWKFGDEGDFTTHGIYKKIIPFQELVLEWQDHPAGQIELKLEFSKKEGGTVLILTNSGYNASKEYELFLEGAKEGWQEQIEKLKAFVLSSPTLPANR